MARDVAGSTREDWIAAARFLSTYGAGAVVASAALFAVLRLVTGAVVVRRAAPAAPPPEPDASPGD
ncbi:hypothetical protein INN71_13805 [Nocardioides sp. ChNu-153]|uniref:hypothetical protein n=1 Tax=Nocardioides sp. ChNu-153 TaxID=2779364 RepID=UPI0026508C48|nr:hypothetical protein [Nocardioides sp. ChNu-153]MDF9714941.1 hypothetical protein [Nocardioides sp. ChNu-99]MDN7122462.1 hypothetical protein [Nocardioides sp. ChNu-153]